LLKLGLKQQKVTAMAHSEREQDRLQMKSGANDPIAGPNPQQVRAHPTEGERMQWGQQTQRTDLDKEMIAATETRPIAEN
jgi:hypothetical protein